MRNLPSASPSFNSRLRAFTLVELMIVLGIIVVLIGILMPAISGVRLAAFEVSTRSRINGIMAACERYQSDFHAYPGPIRNSRFAANGLAGLGTPARQMTMTENMVVGLVGGWEYLPAGAPNYDNGTFDDAKVGSGPIIHNPNDTQRRRLGSYLDISRGTNMTSPGLANCAEMIPGATDTDIPEFIDTFPDAKPILYVRANVGKDGVVGNDDTVQYNIHQLDPYQFSVNATDYQGGNTEYFGNISIANTAKNKDGYLLIGAGKDGKFGTKDDILNTK